MNIDILAGPRDVGGTVRYQRSRAAMLADNFTQSVGGGAIDTCRSQETISVHRRTRAITQKMYRMHHLPCTLPTCFKVLIMSEQITLAMGEIDIGQHVERGIGLRTGACKALSTHEWTTGADSQNPRNLRTAALPGGGGSSIGAILLTVTIAIVDDLSRYACQLRDGQKGAHKYRGVRRGRFPGQAPPKFLRTWPNPSEMPCCKSQTS